MQAEPTNPRNGQIGNQHYEIQYHGFPKGTVENGLDNHGRIGQAFKETFANDVGVNNMLVTYKGNFSVNVESTNFVKDSGTWGGKVVEWRAVKYNVTSPDGKQVVPSTTLRVEPWKQ